MHGIEFLNPSALLFCTVEGSAVLHLKTPESQNIWFEIHKQNIIVFVQPVEKDFLICSVVFTVFFHVSNHLLHAHILNVFILILAKILPK